MKTVRYKVPDKCPNCGNTDKKLWLAVDWTKVLCKACNKRSPLKVVNSYEDHNS